MPTDEKALVVSYDKMQERIAFGLFRECIRAYEAAKDTNSPVCKQAEGECIQTEQPVGQSFEEWCVTVKDCGFEVQLGSATAYQRRLGWDAAMASMNKRESQPPVQKPKKCNPGPCDFQPGLPLMCCKNCDEFY